MDKKADSRQENKINILQRPRRNRKSETIRRMLRETHLTPNDFVLPLFVMEGNDSREPIAAMPGCFRHSRDSVVGIAKEAYGLGIPAVALFPAIDENKKTPDAKESCNPDGLLQKTISDLKSAIPELCVVTDVAMDPYSSDGHDGLVDDGIILNDETLEILANMALSQAKAGADMVAPSDMMDGRVGYIRRALDQVGYSNIGIISYAAKYASAFYGPFREALDSAPKAGDKKTYQMDPGNWREALREVQLDVREGADVILIKPALPYLDIISRVKAKVSLPIAAYNVSGEFAMIKAAAEKGWIDEKAAASEALLSIKRAGADMIFTYHAIDVAKWF